MLPNNIKIDHNSTWSVGNHEDGYLIGINNLISIFEELSAMAAASTTINIDETVPNHLLSSGNDDEQINNNTEHFKNISLKL